MITASSAAAAGPRTYCGIRFRRIFKGRSSRRYLWIHGDETTARDVLESHMRRHKGRAWLVDNPTRTIRNGDMQYDPNRMFTEHGLERNLVRLNPSASEAEKKRIHAVVAKTREKFLRELTPPKKGLLIVLHNNARGYSVKDEVEISNATSLAAPDNPNDFFLCTNPKDFEILKRSPYNVVLQNDAKGEDDGSFSRLAAKRGIRYVNLETAIGRLAQQSEMMEWLEKHLP